MKLGNQQLRHGVPIVDGEHLMLQIKQTDMFSQPRREALTKLRSTSSNMNLICKSSSTKVSVKEKVSFGFICFWNWS